MNSSDSKASLVASFLDSLSRHKTVFESLHLHQEEMLTLLAACKRAIENGGKIVFCGNGGSAADSQHLAAEFVVRYKKERSGLPALALTTDTSILTAYSNDYDFEGVFARQVETLCTKDDVVVGLTTSGNSPNVSAALNACNKLGAYSVAFTGGTGGEIKSIAQLAIVINDAETARIQEAHLFLGHWLCEAFDLLS